VSNSTRRRRDPAELSPRQAKERFLRRRRADRTESSIQSYHGRLKLFVEWCEAVGITEVGDLQPYDINEYYDIRSGDVAATSVENEMYTLKEFCEFLETLGATDRDIASKVPFPDVDRDDRSSDTKLHHDQAHALIRHFRDDPDGYGTRAHVLLELAWFTGARIGGLRALDLRDVDHGENFVEFRHRPGTDTPLKNKYRGERPVAVPPATMQALSTYIQQNRFDVHDKHGRQPLLASARGRPTANTVRTWCYLATLPCVRGTCPHGKEIASCEWTDRDHASKCPSSRSPHPIRTGSITYQLNTGVPREVVSARCDTDQIEEFYDKPGEQERWQRYRRQMERQRRQHVDSLDPFNDDSA
jgi:site-specific recombinase XerD